MTPFSQLVSVKIRKLLLMSILPSSVAVGCGGTKSAITPAGTETKSAHSSSELVPFGEAKLGDRSSCPVSKHDFIVSKDSPKVEYEGKTYYFCCAGCDEEFKKNPNKFKSVH